MKEVTNTRSGYAAQLTYVAPSYTHTTSEVESVYSTVDGESTVHIMRVAVAWGERESTEDVAHY